MSATRLRRAQIRRATLKRAVDAHDHTKLYATGPCTRTVIATVLVVLPDSRVLLCFFCYYGGSHFCSYICNIKMYVDNGGGQCYIIPFQSSSSQCDAIVLTCWRADVAQFLTTTSHYKRVARKSKTGAPKKRLRSLCGSWSGWLCVYVVFFFFQIIAWRVSLWIALFKTLVLLCQGSRIQICRMHLEATRFPATFVPSATSSRHLAEKRDLSFEGNIFFILLLVTYLSTIRHRVCVCTCACVHVRMCACVCFLKGGILRHCVYVRMCACVHVFVFWKGYK